MSSNQPTIQKSSRFVETKVSKYDLVNAALIAFLVILGSLVLMMLLIWLTSGSRRASPAVFMEFPPVTSEEEGEEDDLDDPGAEDFPEVDIPQLATALEAIPDALTQVQASLDARSGSASQMGRGTGRGSRRGAVGVPEHKRWVIQYESDSINSYARQLSFFQIDIGVFYKTSPRIFRLNDPAGSQQVISSSRDEEQKTLRFMHKERRMTRWDEELVKRSGISLEPDGISCQFYPDSTRQLLRNLEGAALQTEGRELKNVRNTYFKIEPDGGGFAFKVVQIVYR